MSYAIRKKSPLEDREFTVSVLAEVLAGSANDAARFAFHNVRERLQVRPKLQFYWITEERTRGHQYEDLRLCSLVLTAKGSERGDPWVEIYDTDDDDTAKMAAPMAPFNVCIQVSTTADSAQVAVKYALDDLSDNSIPAWLIDVGSLGPDSRPQTQTFSLTQGADY